MKPIARRVTAERRGSVLVLVAVVMVSLLGFLALTLDVGAGNRQRRIAQTAADAGATTGAAEILRHGNATQIHDAAVRGAFFNQFTGNGEVIVNYPPLTASVSDTLVGNLAFVEVIVARNIPTLFGGLFNRSSLDIQAHAVAGVGSHSNFCVWSLSPTLPLSLDLDHGSGLRTNCGVAVNSTASNAVQIQSGGDLVTGGLAVVGGVLGGQNATPAPQMGVPPVPDPLSFLVAPTVTSADCVAHPSRIIVSGNPSYAPGVYCGGFDVSNGSVTANFADGTYVIAGGGLTIGSSGVVNAAGVTFVFTDDPRGTYAYGGINFGTGCKANMTAPTIPPYKGVLMFQDPAVTTSFVNTFACASDTPIIGTLYFPTQEILFNGSNANTEIQGGVIANQVTVSAQHVTLNSDPNGATTALRRITLVR